MGSREYPERPVVGIGAVIVLDGKVVLIKRGSEPLKGQWSLPGGGVEVGETLEECVVREMREETGLDVEVGPVIEVFDRITCDPQGRVQYHYVLVDYRSHASQRSTRFNRLLTARRRAHVLSFRGKSPAM